MRRYLYYPGCSAEATGKAYDISTRAVMEKLGIDARRARRLELLRRHELLLGARARLVRHRGAQPRHRPADGRRRALRHLQRLLHHAGQGQPLHGREPRGVRGRPGRPRRRRPHLRRQRQGAAHHGHPRQRHRARGVREPRRPAASPACRVAPYYGCQFSRPMGEFDDVQMPTTMDRLFQATGADVITDFDAKTDCCGGMMMLTRADAALRLCHELLTWRQAGRRRRHRRRLPALRDEPRGLPAAGQQDVRHRLRHPRHVLHPAGGAGARASTRSSSPSTSRSSPVTASSRRSRRERRGGDDTWLTRRSPSTSATAAATSPARSTWRRSRRGPPSSPTWWSRASTSTCAPIPGQDLIKEDIQKLGVNRVVVAACSPTMHEPTFRKAAADAGLNPYLLQMANVREHCSWVTEDKDEATEKAKRILSAQIHRLPFNQPLDPIEVPVNPAVMVVGGGIAGIEAALKLSATGKKVYLVEQQPEHRRPHGDVRQDVPDARLRGLHPDAQDVGGRQGPQHHHARLQRGRGGRRLRRQLQGQGPQEGPLRQHRHLHRLRRLPGRLRGAQGAERVRPGARQAHGHLHPVPAGRAAARDHRPRRSCLTLKGKKCKQPCTTACGPQAIDFEQQDEVLDLEVGRDHHGHGLRALGPHARDPLRLRQVRQRHHQPRVRAHLQRLRARPAATSSQERRGAQVGRDPALRRQPRRELPGALLARVLHVLAQVQPPHQGAPARDRGVRVLHRHAHLRQGLRGVLQAAHGRGRAHGARPRRRGQQRGALAGGRGAPDRQGRGHAARHRAAHPGGHGDPLQRPRAGARTPRRSARPSGSAARPTASTSSGTPSSSRSAR